MTTVTWTPCARPAYAIAWAAFPALIVTTPARRASGESRDIALTAPRTLNEPVRWRFSSFRNASAPIRSPSEWLETRGVRRMWPAITGRARWASASPIVIEASPRLAFLAPWARQDSNLGPADYESAALDH